MDTTADAAVSVRQSGDSVKLTVAMPYYGHPASLLLQIDTFANYPKHLRDKLKIVIIDDGSPPGLQAKAYIYLRRRSSSNSGNRGNNSDGKSIVNDNGNNTNDISDLLDLRLFYIATNIDFNMAGAKNLACHVCETSRILLLDLDVTVPEESMTKILDLETRSSLSLGKGSGSGTTYTKHHFNRTYRNKIHPGVSLQDVGAYFEAGGCDEDFAGSYGSEDADFHSRWRLDPSRHERKHAEIYLRHPSDYRSDKKIHRCSSGILRSELQIVQCRNATANLFLPKKESERNRVLLREKTKRKRWSNLYLRFPWYQVTI
mmetsp:Transcript_51032/g.123067  ORF Transcript_51032/g.123067 Transcript_51032/m.123067 type:complete len:316 (-) Transcript_51032:3412-4359(-)